MQTEIIYPATFGMIFIDFIFRRYKWSNVEFCWKNTTFHPIKFFCEKRGGHSKRDRVEIIEQHPKPVLQGDITENRRQFLK